MIKLYNKYKGSLNNVGTVTSDEQIAEWIVLAVEEVIDEKLILLQIEDLKNK